MPTDVETILTKYQDLIHQQAAVCARKLPPQTVLSKDDLFQEGAVALIWAIHKYKADRGVKLITFLTVCLKNRYWRLLQGEWHRAPFGASVTDEDYSKVLTCPPEQLGLVEAYEALARRRKGSRAALANRYGRLEAS